MKNQQMDTWGWRFADTEYERDTTAISTPHTSDINLPDSSFFVYQDELEELKQQNKKLIDIIDKLTKNL